MNEPILNTSIAANQDDRLRALLNKKLGMKLYGGDLILQGPVPYLQPTIKFIFSFIADNLKKSDWFSLLKEKTFEDLKNLIKAYLLVEKITSTDFFNYLYEDKKLEDILFSQFKCNELLRNIEGYLNSTKTMSGHLERDKAALESDQEILADLSLLLAVLVQKQEEVVLLTIASRARDELNSQDQHFKLAEKFCLNFIENAGEFLDIKNQVINKMNIETIKGFIRGYSKDDILSFLRKINNFKLLKTFDDKALSPQSDFEYQDENLFSQQILFVTGESFEIDELFVIKVGITLKVMAVKYDGKLTNQGVVDSLDVIMQPDVILHHLPFEMTTKVLKFLNDKELKNFSETCKFLRSASLWEINNRKVKQQHEKTEKELMIRMVNKLANSDMATIAGGSFIDIQSLSQQVIGPLQRLSKIIESNELTRKRFASECGENIQNIIDIHQKIYEGKEKTPEYREEFDFLMKVKKEIETGTQEDMDIIPYAPSLFQ